MFISRSTDLKKRKSYAYVFAISAIAAVSAMIIHFAVALRQYSGPVDLSRLPALKLSSESIDESGAFKKETGRDHGNLSPQLTIEGAEGLSAFEIVMIDHDGNDWLHWIACVPSDSGDDRVAISEGAFTDREQSYVGPYPPSGTHTYTIYVFGMVGESRYFDTALDRPGADIKSIAEGLDNGLYTDYHNVKAMGSITGTYSSP